MVGIKAAHDKLVDMTEHILLRGPVSFLIICNHEHMEHHFAGPFFQLLLHLVIFQRTGVIMIKTAKALLVKTPRNLMM